MKQNFKLTKDQQTLVEKKPIHRSLGHCQQHPCKSRHLWSGVWRSVSGRVPVALQGRFYLQCRTGAVFNLRQKGCEKWTPLLLPKNL